MAGSTVIDARWIGKRGAGTFTEMLLAGLGELTPSGDWLVWGDPSLAPHMWPGSTLVPTKVDPADWFGQRSAFRVPAGAVVVHPHQTRPVHRRPAATCVLDLIQLRHPSLPIRTAMRMRLQASIRAAALLFTISDAVREEMSATFGIDPSTVRVLHLPVDQRTADRIADRRVDTPPQRTFLSVGSFFRHKNLKRLIEGFARSRFAADGGQLHLAGGTAEQLDLGDLALPPCVRVLGPLDAAGLEDAMTSALVLVQASLVEGYGLPVSEALLAGIPVVSSPVPAVTEFGPANVPTFDPMSVSAITDAIDETVDLVETGRYWDQVDRASWAAKRPTPRDLAEEVVDGLTSSGFGRS